MRRSRHDPGARNPALSTYVLAALGAHAASPLAYWAAPTILTPLLATLAALHLGAFVAGVLPRSTLLGPNLRRCPPDQPPLTQEGGTGQVALTFDDGPDLTTTPRVLELLHDANATATFFCIGERAQRHPGIVRQIVQAGHLVENHTFSHPLHFGFLGPRALAREIDRTQRILTELTGRRPELFRAPAGIRSPLLQPLLARRGLRLTSWSRRGFDAVLSDPEEILRRVRQGLTAGDIVLLHDGQAHPFATTDSARPILDVLPRLLDHLKAVGLRGVALHS